MEKLPKNFQKIQERYGSVIEKMQDLGKAANEAGPLDEKTSHLIQMAAGVVLRSEGGVHSHAKRAKAAGATADEIRHVMILLIPTIGFPTVAAGLSWIDDVVAED